MRKPVGTVVAHKKTSRLGVVVSPPHGVSRVAHSLVQFAEDTGTPAEEVPDEELEAVKQSRSVTPDVITHAPELVKDMVKKSGPVTVDYGDERFLVVLLKNGDLGLVRIA